MGVMTAVVTPTDLSILNDRARADVHARVKQLYQEADRLLEVLNYHAPEASDIYPKISYLWEEADRMRDAYVRWVALEEVAR